MHTSFLGCHDVRDATEAVVFEGGHRRFGEASLHLESVFDQLVHVLRSQLMRLQPLRLQQIQEGLKNDKMQDSLQSYIQVYQSVYRHYSFVADAIGVVVVDRGQRNRARSNCSHSPANTHGPRRVFVVFFASRSAVFQLGVRDGAHDENSLQSINRKVAVFNAFKVSKL